MINMDEYNCYLQMDVPFPFGDRERRAKQRQFRSEALEGWEEVVLEIHTNRQVRRAEEIHHD